MTNSQSGISNDSAGAGFVRVGKVKDAHGVKGELFIVLFAGEAEWLERLEDIRLVQESGSEGARLLALKSVRQHKNGLIVKSPDIQSRNDAEALKGWLFEIPEEFLVSEPGESIYLREVLGFRVFKTAHGEAGTIVGFSHNNAQDLLVIQTPNGEFEVPFVEAYVDRMDFEAREIHMTLPEGLLGELPEGDDKDADKDDGASED